MKRHHVVLAIALLLMVAGWLAWSTLLTESEMPEGPPATSLPAP